MKQIAIIFLVMTLVGCAPSAQSVQTAIAQTQIALPTFTPPATATHAPTETQIPTPTATLTPTPILTPTLTSTPIVYDVEIQVTTEIKAWDIMCIFKIPCTLMQITWQIGGSTNSCTTAGDTPGCSMPFTQKSTVKDGDKIRVVLDSKDADMSASCLIYVNKLLVSKGFVKGNGSATCEITVAPDLKPIK